MNLTMFCNNFMRTKNILGFEKMLQAIQKLATRLRQNSLRFSKRSYQSHLQAQ